MDVLNRKAVNNESHSFKQKQPRNDKVEACSWNGKKKDGLVHVEQVLTLRGIREGIKKSFNGKLDFVV